MTQLDSKFNVFVRDSVELLSKDSGTCTEEVQLEIIRADRYLYMPINQSYLSHYSHSTVIYHFSPSCALEIACEDNVEIS